ncbi:MAG: hypothetical protein Q8R92_12980 [Deltaproteobacteria bacterium]|nr:hypothetical protein [Deltaproteobacteria bacterium]
MNAVRRIWIGCTIALCAWLMAAGSAGALTDPLWSVDPRPPGPYPVGCSDVAQDFVFAPGDNDRANYWEGMSIGGQGHYVTQLLVEPQGTLTYDVNVPDVRGLFTTFAGQPVPYAAIVCYPTSADNARPDYPYDAALTKFVPRMQRGSEPPLWADASARYPVLLYSHGLSGSPMSGEYLETITLFASYGYVVVAPFHGDGRFADVSIDSLSDLVNLFFGGELREVVELQAIRPLSLQSALDALLADPNYRDHVDPGRVAGFGISLGGESLLLVSGARLTTDFANLQSTQVMSDPRLKAISGYVPYFGQRLLPAFGDDQQGVDGMTVPFLGIVGMADETAPLLLTEQGVNRMLGARYVVAFDGLTHDLVLADLPDIVTWTLTFFDAYLDNSAAARAQIARMNEVKGGAADSVRIAYTPPLSPANGEQMPVYRFVNMNTGEHFYTINEAERNAVVQNYNWFRYEGIGFYAYPIQQPGTLPVHRFVNTNAGDHFYTINESEKDTVIRDYNWFRYEGIGFYAYPIKQPGTLPVHRFVNMNAGDHFYTINEAEKDAVIQNYGWFGYEGIGFYAYPSP